jgi:uncharacterized membrane protein
MRLPDLSIPNLPLIGDIIIPSSFHPFVIHLVISLPIIIIILEFINLFARRKLLGSISFFFMILFSITLFVSYLSGVSDANLIKDSLDEATKTVLQQHKMEGIYIVYGSLLLLFIKLLSVVVRKLGIKLLFLLFLMVFTSILANVAIKGTKLVYKYGVASKLIEKNSQNSTQSSSTTDNKHDSNSSN